MRRREFLASAPLSALPLFLRGRSAAASGSAAVESAQATAADDGAAPRVEFYSDRWAVAPRIKQPPSLDGTLGDPLWAKAAVLKDFRVPYYNTPVDQQISGRLLCGPDALYIGLVCPHQADDQSLANVDVLLSAAGHGVRFFRVAIPIRQVDPAYTNEWGDAITDLTDISTHTLVGATKTTAEMAVPYAELGGADGAAGSEWRVNVLAEHEMMTRPLSSWVPIRRSTNYYAGRGANVLSDVTGEGRAGSVFLGSAPAPASGSTSPAPWRPRGLTLTYQGFADKVLSFFRGSADPRDSIDLRWKSVSDPWVAIDDVERAAEAHQVSLAFKHPPPSRDGLYQLQVIKTAFRDREHPRSMCVLTFDRDALIQAGDTLYDPTGE